MANVNANAIDNNHLINNKFHELLKLHSNLIALKIKNIFPFLRYWKSRV